VSSYLLKKEFFAESIAGSNGHVGEFRFYLEEIDKISNSYDHNIYRIRRTIEDSLAQNGKTPGQENLVNAINTKISELYQEAMADLGIRSIDTKVVNHSQVICYG
jgi:hypothetical protein